MKSFDFEYDDLNLSDLGYIICNFNSVGLETVTGGSQISFNTIPVRNGEKFELISSEYDECLSAKFQICKNLCNEKNAEISFKEYRDLMSWLNRKEFHKFKFLDGEYLDLFFNASFNLSRIELDGRLIGLELDMITDSPFAYQESEIININNQEENNTKIIYSKSDVEGYIYPYMEIKMNQSGDLTIYNSLDDRTMHIANCNEGEIITLDYPVIQSSDLSHKIQNDFNWNFFRIVNTFKNKKNVLTISVPCEIKIKYNPLIKFGM
ncbi:MAG: hypothetical protein NC548_37970 [Lachnospiraceae bacterium]|nr:hypothetical protein [Lachnospiraceae bacterium]